MAVWHESMQSKVLDERPLRTVLVDVLGGGSPPWHSLTHTISIYIEDSPGALNYIWASTVL